MKKRQGSTKKRTGLLGVKIKNVVKKEIETRQFHGIGKKPGERATKMDRRKPGRWQFGTAYRKPKKSTTKRERRSTQLKTILYKVAQTKPYTRPPTTKHRGGNPLKARMPKEEGSTACGDDDANTISAQLRSLSTTKKRNAAKLGTQSSTCK